MAMGYRRALKYRPINSLKHIVDISQQLPINTQLNLVLIKSSDAPVAANTADIETAAVVKSLFLKFEVQSNNVSSPGAIPNFYMIIFKNPGGNLTPPNPSLAGSDDNKKHIIHQEMIMMENVGQGGNPRVVFHGVIKIPRLYQRFGLNDLLQCVIKAPAMATVSCLQCIYKELR